MVEESTIKLMPYGEKYNGKHDGWAFQPLNDNYEGFYPGFCCKDYLQDIVWSDLTKKSMTAYGQKSEYKAIIDIQDTLKLCMYPKLLNGLKEPVIENLRDLGVNLGGFLNEIEILMDFNMSSVECTENKLIIEFSREWIKKPYLLSLFTLFCRMGIYYDGNLESYIENPFKPENTLLDKCDLYYLKGNYKQLLDIIYQRAEIQQKDWIELKEPGDVHNSGIFSNIHLIKYKDGIS